ncbi:ATP-binding protein [Planctomycetales bacterium ZRK34]|nr:ATP-binding protein [Planctomycetales bacterium ZRK34]
MARAPIARKLVLESRLEEVSRVEEAIIAAAQEHDYNGHDQFAIKLALEEALANAIKHGNQSDPQKQVIVEFKVDAKEFSITVSDQGGGFDPACVPDPTLDENLEKPFGRGVMLMNTYMNHISYSPKGNSVTMVRHRTVSDNGA